VELLRISGLSAVLSVALAICSRTAIAQQSPVGPEPGSVTGSESVAGSGSASDSESESDSESGSESESESVAGSESESESESESDSVAGSGSGSGSGSDSGSRSRPVRSFTPATPDAPTPVTDVVLEAAGDSMEPADAQAPAASPKIVYTLERIEVHGNHTREDVIRRFVPLEPGVSLDVDDPAIEQIRWRLMGTGWFNDVRLRLERGSRRGWVVLVIEVEERNTLVISRVIAGLSRVVTSSTSRDDRLRPYGGLGVRESNLFGLGIGLGVSAVAAEDQFAVDVRYHDPMAIGDGYDLRGRAFYNDAREFFGRDPLVSIDCPAPDPDVEDPEPCDPDVLLKRAVVIYDRMGAGIGTGHDLTGVLRYEIDWLGELVQVDAKPRAASTLVGADGGARAPIDFAIDDGTSVVSSLRLGLVLDTRDDPALPARGQHLRLDARIANGAFGSTYDFARYEADFRHFQTLPWGHVLELGAYLGTVVGRAPFFYNFYAADLSDLLPSRALQLNVDHRRTHNLLDTAIQDSDKAELAARLDFEYVLPLHRGGGDVRGVDAYFGAGIFMLADREQLRVGVPGYEGLSRLPVDLTFDVGVQADTTLGLFKVGFSSLIGFLPDLGQEQ
jgi:hypothetical protein